jgi:hypothetical protein
MFLKKNDNDGLDCFTLWVYNDVNPFCLIVSILDCFTLRVYNDGDMRRVTSEGAA